MSVHDSTIAERELPTEIAERFEAIGFDRPPETLGEWVELTTNVLESADSPTGLDAMCTDDRQQHEAAFGDETRHFHCVLDTLLVPFVVDSEGPVRIRSRSPESGELVEIQVSQEEIAVSPPEAVMSFGIASEVQAPIGNPIDPSVAYELFCPYVNAFSSREEYERWDAATGEAITIALTMADGYELARALEETPTASNGTHKPSDGEKE